MPKIARSALVRFSAKQMYDLINDVESYHEFVPGCAGGKVIEANKTMMLASVDVSKAGMRKTFTTRNQLTPHNSIKMQLENGPFNHLIGEWRLIELDESACKVEFELDFEFKSSVADFAFGKIFNELMSSMVSAFSERAKVVYR